MAENTMMMETLEPEGRNVYSAVGRNTFRRKSERYAELNPGDHVLMGYVRRPGDEPHRIEHLTVRATSLGSLGDMLALHAEDNHTVPPRGHIVVTGSNRSGSVFKALERAYGNVRKEEPFIVVHFF